MTIAAILKTKGNAVETIPPKTNFSVIARLLSDKRIGAVPVTDPDGKVLGIVGERDLVRAMANHGARAIELSADQIMTRGTRTVTPDMSVYEAMEAMTVGRSRHLPVVEDGRLVGIVSIGDVVAARLNQQAHEVDSLRAYVAGSA